MPFQTFCQAFAGTAGAASANSANATRKREDLQVGLSPRGALALAQAARATAVLDGRDTGVGAVQSVALLAVVGRGAAAELGVFAAPRVLARDLVSPINVPAHDNSAMDGYALRAADLPGPWQVIGESACGHPFAGAVGSGRKRD